MAKRPRPPPHRAMPWPAGLPSLHPLLAPVVAFAFNGLRIGVVLRDRTQWYPIHLAPQPMLALELQFGKELERRAYNDRWFNRVYEEGRSFRGQHAGLSDFFVPVQVDGNVRGVIITGPFTTARPSSADLLDGWRWLAGREGHRWDRDFVQYVSIRLETLVLEGEQLGRYERLLECFASLCTGCGDAHALAAEAGVLASQLEQARAVDLMWESVRSMVDERSERGWSSSYRFNELKDLGLSQVPEHVLVGLLVGRRDAPDAVAEMVTRDAFQRACVDLARSHGNVVAGRVGEHGIVLLAGASGRRGLIAVGERAASLAERRFGLSLHMGTSSTVGALPLSARYEEALGAAETALSQGLGHVRAEAGAQGTVSPLRRLREQLGAVTEDRPEVLVARFERYVDAVAAHCGYRLEAVRAHLDTGFDRAVHALSGPGALGKRSEMDMYEALDRAARDAPTVGELVAAYRRAIADLVHAAEHPVPAAQEQSLRRALDFIRQHFTERLSLSQTARVAGFAPRYFSRVFKRRESVTFEAYVRRLRLERARHLLETSELSVERVAQLSGFPLRPYFYRVFKRLYGQTPVEFRSSKPRTP